MGQTLWEREFPMPRDAEGNRVFVTVKLTRRLGPSESVTHEDVTEWVSASFTGEVIGRHCNRDNDGSVWAAGQIVGSVPPTVAKVWTEYHLNGMQSHCAHQDRATPWDKCPPCPETGYKAGSAWLVRPLTVADIHAIGRAFGVTLTVITRDGDVVAVTDGDALPVMHQLQPQSMDYATRYLGYAIHTDDNDNDND